MTKARKRKTETGYLAPAPLRGPDDPTEYEVAAATMSSAELDAWVRRWWRSRYVPEEVLTRLGLVEQV